MKYMGSKSKISKEILPIILKNRKPNQYYIELFVGGCNSIDKVDGLRIGNDINPFLIAMWNGLQNDCQRPRIINKDTYSYWRSAYNEKRISYTDEEMFMMGWVGFMASFNGRFFDGGYSGHNVNGRDYISEQIRNTESQIDNIKGINFTSLDYSELAIPNNSILYLDIPYKDTKQYSYSKDFDYEKLYKYAEQKTQEGHDVFISEYTAPDDFVCIWQKEVTNAMNTTKTYRPIEKLFVHHSIAKKYIKVEKQRSIQF